MDISEDPIAPDGDTPATAPDQSDPVNEPWTAPVVSLAARRGVKTQATPAAFEMDKVMDEALLEEARRFWVKVLEEDHVDLGSPDTVAVVASITRHLEHLVTGLVKIRTGCEGLPADPRSGADLTSALEFTGLLRDLATAARLTQELRG